MYTCSDIKNIAKYISQSGLELKSKHGNKSFFVPFFVEQSTENFKKSVAISSAYLDLHTIPFFSNSNQFKLNTTIPKIVENSIGIPSDDFMYKCFDISKSIDKNELDYLYLSKKLDIFFKDKEV